MIVGGIHIIVPGGPIYLVLSVWPDPGGVVSIPSENPHGPDWMVSCPHVEPIVGWHWINAWSKWGVVGPIKERFAEVGARCEAIRGNQGHGAIHQRWGTQPFGAYLRGHVGNPKKVRLTSGEIVEPPGRGGYWLCQMYYWNPYDGDRDIVPYMVQVLNFGLKALLMLGWVSPSTNVYLENNTTRRLHGSIDDYECSPFLLFKVASIMELFALPMPDVLARFREFGRYGLDYTDKRRACSLIGEEAHVRG